MLPYEYTLYFRYWASNTSSVLQIHCYFACLLLVLSIYRYIVDTDMTDVSIQSGQSKIALETRTLLTGAFCPYLKRIFWTVEKNRIIEHFQSKDLTLLASYNRRLSFYQEGLGVINITLLYKKYHFLLDFTLSWLSFSF